MRAQLLLLLLPSCCCAASTPPGSTWRGPEASKAVGALHSLHVNPVAPSIRLELGDDAIHRRFASELDAMERGGSVRIQGWLLSTSTVIDGTTLERRILRAVRKGVDVRILWGPWSEAYNPTTIAQVTILNVACYAYGGSACVVRPTFVTQGASLPLKLLHQKTASFSQRGCMASSGDLNSAGFINAAVWMSYGSVCRELDDAFARLWNAYKPLWVRRVAPPDRGHQDVDLKARVLTTVDAAEAAAIPTLTQSHSFASAYLDDVRSAERTVLIADQYVMWEQMVAVLLERAPELERVTVVTNCGYHLDSQLEHESLRALRALPNADFVCATCAWMHAKALVVDDRVMIIGSHTLEPNALRHNYESSVRIEGTEVPRLASQLRGYLSLVNRCPHRGGEALAKNIAFELEEWDYAAGLTTN